MDLIVASTPRAASGAAEAIVAPGDAPFLIERVAALGAAVKSVRVDGPAWYVGSVLSGLRASGAAPVVEVSRQTGPWHEAAGGGRVGTLSVEATWLPAPLIAEAVAVGGACETGDRAGVASVLAGFGGDPSSWSVRTDDAEEQGAWGWRVGAPGAARAVKGAEHVEVLRIDPATGGGLLGLVRGVAGLMSGAQRSEARSFVARGHGAVAIDGLSHARQGRASFAVRRGPSVALARAD